LETAGGMMTTEISHNILRNVGECGVCANSDKAVILCNEISYAGHELIDMHSSNPTIKNNILGPNPDKAGIIIDAGNPVIENNYFKRCQGIFFIDEEGISTEAVIRHNSFEEGTEINAGCSVAIIEQNNIYGRFITGSNCDINSISAANNYWGTTDAEEIQERIKGAHDSPVLRKVMYKPFLERPVPAGLCGN